MGEGGTDERPRPRRGETHSSRHPGNPAPRAGISSLLKESQAPRKPVNRMPGSRPGLAHVTFQRRHGPARPKCEFKVSPYRSSTPSTLQVNDVIDLSALGPPTSDGYRSDGGDSRQSAVAGRGGVACSRRDVQQGTSRLSPRGLTTGMLHVQEGPEPERSGESVLFASGWGSPVSTASAVATSGRPARM